ncbi:MAG: Fur family transcriptional regulator [Deinococcales bacterium]
MAIVRFTRQRQAVFTVVQQSKQHPDAARIFEAVRQIVPSISLGTVYRSLEVLVQEGYLLQIQQPGMPTRYDARLENHAHFVCDCCGAVEDVLIALPDLRPKAAAALKGFDIQTVRVEFHGRCPKCQQN